MPWVLASLSRLAADADDGAPPQLGGVGVPHDGGVVVVAVRAQRPAQAGVVFLVPLAAGEPPPVRAVVRLAPWAAAGDPAAVGGDAGVDGAEGGGGEGGEHARVDGDRLGHAFAACQPGADELVGVGAVGLGAGRADRGAPVPAREVDRLVRQVLGVQVAEDLPGGGVDVADGAAQPDRADAPACGQGGGQPLLVVVAGGAVEQLGIEGPGARSWPGRSSTRTGTWASAGLVMRGPGRALAGGGAVEGEGEAGRPRPMAGPAKRPGSPLSCFPSVFSHSV